MCHGLRAAPTGPLNPERPTHPQSELWQPENCYGESLYQLAFITVTDYIILGSSNFNFNDIKSWNWNIIEAY